VNPVKPRFFRTPADFRAWLERHHASARELLVGYYKRGSGRPSITWPESVDEALAFGWIDGVRKRVDDERYTIRFTPRRRGSIWSVVNTKRAVALTKAGRMHASGVKVFNARDKKKTRLYSFERAAATLPASFVDKLRANSKAWASFEAAPPWYKRTATHWIMSAKQEATRERRLALLVESCARGVKASPFL
jgi:uncharacterized protein YdeI (YjbR/CyaY-like superfamily)